MDHKKGRLCLESCQIVEIFQDALLDTVRGREREGEIKGGREKEGEGGRERERNGMI